MKKSIFLCLVVLSSMTSFADSVYDCRAKKTLSGGTLEAGEKLQITIAQSSITIKGQDLGTCKAPASDKNWGYLVSENGLKDCGYDGVDFLIPVDMQLARGPSSLVVAANESFDVYACTKK